MPQERSPGRSLETSEGREKFQEKLFHQKIASIPSSIKLWFVIAIALVALPTVLPLASNIKLPFFSEIIIYAFAVVSLLACTVLILIAKCWIKAAKHEALVITGYGCKDKPKVILNSGTMFFSSLQECIVVPLDSMKLEIQKKGLDALITKDKLRCDINVQFYVKVKADPDAITNAATSLGNRLHDPRAVAELIGDKLVSAMRTVVANKTLTELNEERKSVADEMLKMVTGDIEQNGLLLESVSISSLDQTSPEFLKPKENAFDAEGMRRLTEITSKAGVEANILQRDAESAKAAKDVDTRKAILALEQARSIAEATQQSEIAIAQANKKREAQEFALAQDAKVGQAEQAKQKAIIEAEQQREMANVMREQQVANAEVAKERAVEISRRDKDIQIAQKEAERAEAEAQRLEKECEREQRTQNIETVKVKATAERAKEKTVIEANAQAEQDRVKRVVQATADADILKLRTEAEKAAAENKAVAITTEATAGRDAAKLKAEGAKAEQMVPVDVERESVKVLEQKLKAQTEHSDAALKFELSKLEIQQTALVQIETARATATMLSQAKMTLFGTPQDAATMLERMSLGLGIGNVVQGLQEGGNGQTLALATQIAEGLKGTLLDGLALLAGKNAPNETPIPATQPVSKA